MSDKTALSYWLPKLQAAGLPTPRTTIVSLGDGMAESIFRVFDGEPLGDASKPFFEEMDRVAAEIGFPLFLRTDHTSGKHNWKNTCFVPSAADLKKHIIAIVEFSEMAGVIGLPWDVWAIRELLPTIPYGYCPRYGDMPICKEFRFFVEDGDIKCAHPYWPRFSLEQGGADLGETNYEDLCRMENESELRALASAAGKAVGGAWSIDLLETKRGWFVTDMAEAKKSWHWEGCTA